MCDRMEGVSLPTGLTINMTGIIGVPIDSQYQMFGRNELIVVQKITGLKNQGGKSPLLLMIFNNYHFPIVEII